MVPEIIAQNKIKNIIVERSCYESEHVFSKTALQNNVTDKYQFECLYPNSKYVWVPKCFIYLNTPPKPCLQRIQKRDRKSEVNITLEYLSQLDKFYELLMTQISEKVHIINGEQPVDKIHQQIMNIINNM